MTENELKQRTKKFALRILKLVVSLPNTTIGRAIGGQLVRAGTSVGANYRAACRASSNADFISKLAIVEEEADETLFWLEIIDEMKILGDAFIGSLMKENDEIIAIIVASIKTARQKKK